MFIHGTAYSFRPSSFSIVRTSFFCKLKNPREEGCVATAPVGAAAAHTFARGLIGLMRFVVLRGSSVFGQVFRAGLEGR